MGVSYLQAPENTALLVPTEIAARIGLSSAQAVNALLCERGLQLKFRDHRNRVHYEPTEAGIVAGAQMVDTGKRNGEGVPQRQLRWASTIVESLLESSEEPSLALN